MSAEYPARLDVLHSALKTSREMVNAGPTDEVPINAIDGLADISIPDLNNWKSFWKIQ